MIILISLFMISASAMTIYDVYAQINDFRDAKIHLTRLLLPEVSPVESNIFLIWQDNSTGTGNEEIFLRKIPTEELLLEIKLT